MKNHFFTTVLFAFSLYSRMNVAKGAVLRVPDDLEKYDTTLRSFTVKADVGDTITVSSPKIPLVILKYSAENADDRLVESDDFVVTVRAKCENEIYFKELQESDQKVSVSVEKARTRSGIETSKLIINLDLSMVPTDAQGKRQKMLPPPGIYNATWDTLDYACFYKDADAECRTIFKYMPKFLADFLSIYVDEDILTTEEIANEDNRVTTEEIGNEDIGVTPKTIEKVEVGIQGCVAHAEVIYDACHFSLEVDATSNSIQVFDQHSLQGSTKGTPNTDCMVSNRADLVFPNSAIDTTDEVAVKKFDGVECLESESGRPFIDINGNKIKSDAHVIKDETSQWNLARNFKEDIEDIGINYQAQGNDWTNRALGEYSSIASFAAFTIALMTNNAPPCLIADSLQAAIDEFNHARTSFDMASLLTHQTVSPGPLPAASLSFEQDLYSLAFGAAKEGCVDETVAALILAAEVQKLGANDIRLPGSWKEKVTIIAKEEAMHSALAWRTIHWICSIDQVICDDIISYLKNEGNNRAMRRIQIDSVEFGASIMNDVEQEWIRLSSLLLPLAANEITAAQDLISPSSNDNFIVQVGNGIINNFVEETKEASLNLVSESQ